MHFFKTGPEAIAESSVSLHADWRLLGTPSAACATPAQLEEQTGAWLPAVVPGTVAQALAQAGQWDIRQLRDFDAQDWWYECNFAAEQASQSTPSQLRFSGLATLAEVWLNGERILQADNMFVEYVVDVTSQLLTTNTLQICFRALQSVLAERRARPRWKTKLVQQQQLRWIRTTLLGRIPGWTPPVAPVGPWRAIQLNTTRGYALREITLHPSLQDGVGVVTFECRLELPDMAVSPVASLWLAEHVAELQVEQDAEGYRLHGELRISQPDLWWPHTHGDPRLYPCKVRIETGKESLSLDCGELGFRKVQADVHADGFSLLVNDTHVFCRGACWTVNDIVSIHGEFSELERGLLLARDAGMNMIRIGGTMIYESEAFYRLCDRLGIMVWQDFMFANMDYPIEDAEFAKTVGLEIRQQLQRWQTHPCMAVYCGNSEVEQQAAMLGMPQESWRSNLFSELIPEWCRRWHPGIPYVPSTPSGGTLPFHVGRGVTHYYGVGAYLRPISDVRRANVRFTPECLGFSNVPEDSTLTALFEGQLPVCHHPLWKARVPRDSGPGWDFEDVRDHYLKVLFGADPVTLRSFDMPTYLALGRITTGELMAQVYAEWRSNYSDCGGGLVWFYKDLWQGAGWGIIDSDTNPKACYRYLQRAWQPQTVVLTDEGLDGVHAHVINEKAETLACRLEFSLWRNGQVLVARAERELQLAPRSSITLESDALLQGFYDVAYAYRFGPPKHDVVVACLLDARGECIAESVYFPGARKMEKQRQVQLHAEAVLQDNGNYLLGLETDALLQAVHFDIRGYSASDEYFHLLPGRRRHVILRPNGETVKRFRGYVESLSLEEAVGIHVA